MLRGALTFAAALALAACGTEAPQIDTGTYGAAENWDNPGGDWAGSRFSRLDRLTKDNVGELGLAWELSLIHI